MKIKRNIYLGERVLVRRISAFKGVITKQRKQIEAMKCAENCANNCNYKFCDLEKPCICKNWKLRK